MEDGIDSRCLLCWGISQWHILRDSHYRKGEGSDDGRMKSFFWLQKKTGTFLPPSTQTLHFLAKESPVCRISSFFIRQSLLSQSFYTVPCSHFPILWCTLTTNRHNTQWVDSESIPWLHRSRFALVLTGAFLEIYFLMRSRKSCWVQIGNIYSLWTDMEPDLGRFFTFFLYDKSTKRVHFILIVYDSYTFLEVRNNHHSSESTDLTFTTYDEHAHEGDK